MQPPLIYTAHIIRLNDNINVFSVKRIIKTKVLFEQFQKMRSDFENKHNTMLVTSEGKDYEILKAHYALSLTTAILVPSHAIDMYLIPIMTIGREIHVSGGRKSNSCIAVESSEGLRLFCLSVVKIKEKYGANCFHPQSFITVWFNQIRARFNVSIHPTKRASSMTAEITPQTPLPLSRKYQNHSESVYHLTHFKKKIKPTNRKEWDIAMMDELALNMPEMNGVEIIIKPEGSGSWREDQFLGRSSIWITNKEFTMKTDKWNNNVKCVSNKCDISHFGGKDKCLADTVSIITALNEYRRIHNNYYISQKEEVELIRNIIASIKKDNERNIITLSYFIYIVDGLIGLKTKRKYIKKFFAMERTINIFVKISG